MQKELPKRLLLKLGTACNLSCPHCHQVQKSFTEHPRLVQWIKEQGFKRITFSGGEPLMYFDTIKRIMTELGHDPVYRMMSNGTLLTPEIAEFFNDYNVMYAISYDGRCGGRDLAVPIQWSNVNRLKRGLSTCTIFSDPNFSFRDFAKDMKGVVEGNNLKCWVDTDFLKINWIHQTKEAPNAEFTREVADRFIEQATRQLDQAFYCWSVGEIDDSVIKHLTARWYVKSKIKHGTACCNEILTSVNLDGAIMQCPYGTNVIGTIDNMPSLELMDSFIPQKCKTCEHWEICRCSCVASVTDLDCYVNRTMIPIIVKLIEKYGFKERFESLFQ